MLTYTVTVTQRARHLSLSMMMTMMKMMRVMMTMMMVLMTMLVIMTMMVEVVPIVLFACNGHYELSCIASTDDYGHCYALAVATA